MRTRSRNDTGLSLVELSVSMFVASVLFAAIGTVFIAVTGAVRTTTVKTSTTADVRIAMEAMTRALRVAYQPPSQTAAIVSATATSISFYALLNRTGSDLSTIPDATLIEYSYSGQCLNEKQTPARTVTSSGTVSYFWDTGTVTKCLLRTTQPPALSYYTTGAGSTSMTIPVGGLALTERTTVQSVQMTLTAQDPMNPSVAGVPMTDRVTLTNVVAASGGS